MVIAGTVVDVVMGTTSGVPEADLAEVVVVVGHEGTVVFASVSTRWISVLRVLASGDFAWLSFTSRSHFLAVLTMPAKTLASVVPAHGPQLFG